MSKKKLPETQWPALQKFVVKGVSTKAAAEEAKDELRELIDALEEIHGEMEDAFMDWNDGDDSETRADGKERLEQIVNDLDEPLSNAGHCAGQEPYDPEAYL